MAVSAVIGQQRESWICLHIGIVSGNAENIDQERRRWWSLLIEMVEDLAELVGAETAQGVQGGDNGGIGSWS